MSTFHGLLTALVTPFRDGALDEAAFRALVRRQIEGGVDGLVPVGTTGEAPTLPIDEHLKVVRWAVEEADGAVPVLAGIGSNSTLTACTTAKKVEQLGVQGVLATAPYYNKPTQEGVFQHYLAVAAATPLEVCLYDVPGRSVIRIEPATVERLADVPTITAIKDATGDMGNATEIHRRCGDRVSLLSGDDFTTLPFLCIGGVGSVSVASNVAPALMKALVVAARERRLDEAIALHERLFPLFGALFFESNPAPTKGALASLRLCTDDVRLPLVPATETCRQAMDGILRDLDLLP